MPSFHASIATPMVLSLVALLVGCGPQDARRVSSGGASGNGGDQEVIDWTGDDEEPLSDECVDPVVSASEEEDSDDPGPDARFNSVDGVAALMGTLEPAPNGNLFVMQPIEPEDIIDEGGQEYARLSVGGLSIRIDNDESPPPPAGTAPADIHVRVGQLPLLSVAIMKSYSLRTPTSGQPIAQLSKVSIANANTGEALGDPLGVSVNPGLPVDCETAAVQRFALAPYGMPAVKFPKVEACGEAGCVDALYAWLRAHHHVWRARQMMAVVNGMAPEHRAFFWGQPGLDAQGIPMVEQSSPAYWFGAYNTERFAAIRQVIDKLSSMLLTNYTNNTKIKLHCPSSSADLCFTATPSAHHAVKGTVELCEKYFGRHEWQQSRLLAHELLHHRFVSWQLNGAPRHDPLMDTHTHGHGSLCGGSVVTEKHYGLEDIRHLATYANQHNDHCHHRSLNIRNNDTYAYFVTTIGEMIYSGDFMNDASNIVEGKKMVAWPQPSEPTQKPPTECDFGTENCQCLPTMPFGEGSTPDGDYDPESYCPDYDGELSCVKTKFNASDTVGVCKRCSEQRGPGCECNGALPCDVGECYGDDTFGGGTGHCYLSPTPKWACLADCDRLFNDDLAYCYHDYPTGGRCMDSDCTPDKAYSCYQQGKTCRYGACIVECGSNQECSDYGYPPSFICTNNRCEPS